MINVILPLTKFFFTLLIAMLSVGVLERGDGKKTKTTDLAVIVFVPFTLVHIIGVTVTTYSLSSTIYLYILLLYFIIPFIILFLSKDTSNIRALVYSSIICGANVISGAAVGYFVSEMV